MVISRLFAEINSASITLNASPTGKNFEDSLTNTFSAWTLPA